MLKYVFSAIFVLLAWALVFVFPEVVRPWIGIVATAGVALVLGAIIVVKRLKRAKASARIEAGLGDQARSSAGNMRPDQAAQIEAMQAEFAKAVNALKSSKKGGDALGTLPIYVIIGPPGAGKTTALRNSGLRFPQSGRGAVKGIGGTRNCDWWLTNDAILLDTAGRWTTEDDDHDEWLAFLDLMRRSRPSKPINGILLAVSINELLAEDADMEVLAGKLRERMDEVVSRLHMVVPVYLLVTKCDLLPGFVETFGDLRDKDRGQIWGLTLPLLATADERDALFAEQLEELAQVTEQRMLGRLGEERTTEGRTRVFEFPQHFAALRPNLLALAQHAFAENAYEDGPILRGAYFTSGTQEGAPIDRVMAKMAAAFGVAARVSFEAPRKPRSYFVRDLFVDVVFPDRDVAVRSAAARKKDRLLRLATACGAMAAAAAFLLLPISSYLDNRHFAQGALSFVEKLAEAREGGGRKGEGAALTAKGLEAVAPNLGQLAQFETSGPNLMMGWGLYVGDKLMNPLARAVSQLLLQPLVEHDASVLADLLKGKAADPDPFGALVAYMLLTQPKEPGEPSPEASDWSSKWIGRAADAAADRWEKVSGERASKKARQAVRDGVSFVLLRQRKAGEDLALPERRSEVVKRVRQILDAANESDPIAAFIKDPTMPRDVRLRDIVGAQVMLFRSSDNQADAGPSLPGAFTPDGWRVVAKRLKRLVEDEDDDDMAWVLGSPNDQKEKRQASAGPLQTSYFRRYIDAWRAFLLSLSMKEQPTLEGARGMISTLLSTKALDALWRTAEKNLVIKDESPLGLLQKRAEGALQKRANELREKILGKKTEEGSGKKKRLAGDEPDEPAAVEAEYAAFLAFGRGRQQGQQPGLELYYQILNEVQGALGESGAPDAKAFQGVYRTQLTKLRGLANQYNDNGWEGQLLLKLLMPPLGSAEAAVVGAGGDSANRKWCENIVVAWDQQLAGRYPFVTGKDVRDARVPDIEKFFQPGGGTLWQYFGEALKGDIDHPSGTTVFRPKEESSVRYRPDLIDFLEKAQRLTDALFAGKEPGKLYVPVRVRLKPSPPYVRITFKTGSKSVLYFNQKERWEEVGWPNAGAYLVSDFKGAQSETGFKNIEMGLFHLLDQGSVQRKSEDEDFLAAVFSPDDGQGKINADFQPAGLTKLFKGFTVPRAVVAGAKPCAR